MKIYQNLVIAAVLTMSLGVSCTSSDGVNENKTKDSILHSEIELDNGKAEFNKYSAVESEDDIERKEIKLALLPPSITQALKDERFSEFKVNKAFVIKHKKEKLYEIRTAKMDKRHTLIFNPNGILIAEK